MQTLIGCMYCVPNSSLTNPIMKHKGQRILATADCSCHSLFSSFLSLSKLPMTGMRDRMRPKTTIPAAMSLTIVGFLRRISNLLVLYIH